MNKNYTINDINNILIDYIENNEVKYAIKYLDSIKTLKVLLDNIEFEYLSVIKD